MEVDRIDRELLIERPEMADALKRYSDQYTEILNHSENHATVDFLRVLLDNKLKLKVRSRWLYVEMAKVYSRYLLGFIHYPIVIVVELWFVYSMVQPGCNQ